VVPAVTDRKPESMPPANFVHGFANVDCVTEWSPAWNMKLTVSPVWACKLEGVYVSPPSPTRTWWLAAETARMGTKVAMAVEKRILERDQKRDYGWKGLDGWNWNERALLVKL